MEVTAVKLRNSYQIYHVSTNSLFLRRNTLCIVDTEHGVDIGRVFKCPSHIHGKKPDASGRLLRKATVDDLKVIPDIEAIERRAFTVCRDKAREKKLEMKLVSVKCLFDKTKIIFYFVADNRIDFRELVRDLATVFRTRIEMRQIGVRDEARIIGGFGPCGRELCCGQLKEEFEPVSIKMAKEQSLNLNSLKISGMCGRLLCCLGYEYQVYRELNESMPRLGTQVRVAQKTYSVDMVEPLKGLVRMRCGDHSIEVQNSDITRSGSEYSISQEVLQRVTGTLAEEAEDDIPKYTGSRKDS